MRLRLVAGAPPSPMSASFFIAETRAFCTSSHSSQPPTRLSNICCVFEAFSACPRRLIAEQRERLELNSARMQRARSFYANFTQEITSSIASPERQTV